MEALEAVFKYSILPLVCLAWLGGFIFFISSWKVYPSLSINEVLISLLELPVYLNRKNASLFSFVLSWITVVCCLHDVYRCLSLSLCVFYVCLCVSCHIMSVYPSIYLPVFLSASRSTYLHGLPTSSSASIHATYVRQSLGRDVCSSACFHYPPNRTCLP